MNDSYKLPTRVTELGSPQNRTQRPGNQLRDHTWNLDQFGDLMSPFGDDDAEGHLPWGPAELVFWEDSGTGQGAVQILYPQQWLQRHRPLPPQQRRRGGDPGVGQGVQALPPACPSRQTSQRSQPQRLLPPDQPPAGGAGEEEEGNLT